MEPTEELKACGRTIMEHGLSWGNSGNISVRTDSDHFLISAGGTNLGKLNNEGIISCSIVEETYEGLLSPSMETGLHRGIYGSCDEANAIIHAQPFYSTLFACSEQEIRTDFLPEAMAYLRTIERVPYHHAGSRELAEATNRMARNHRVLLLNNHGVVCWGTSLDEALLSTQTLEFCCQLLIASKNSGLDLNYLGPSTTEDFLRHLQSIGR